MDFPPFANSPRSLANNFRIDSNFRNRIVGICGFLVAVNIGAWVWAIIAFIDKPVLLGTAVLAYTFGLRHAVDADHIAAIDNVTRKLMQDGKRPGSVGLYFALGHSTIVIIAALVAYWTTSAAQKHFEFLKDIGGIVSTGISAFFLIAIALINMVILRGVYRAFQQARTNFGALLEWTVISSKKSCQFAVCS
jgi:high-affinity nickel-transport protein